MAKQRDPYPSPELTYEDGWWTLEEEYRCPVNGSLLKIPKGFRFDLASIPRLFWVVPGFAPFELSTAAPLVHDYLYRFEGHLPAGQVVPPRRFTRREADMYFRLIMKNEGVGVIRRTLAWWGVRLGGWIAWRGG